ncbi:MAG: TIGR03435 family protein [Bryobacterales bacterium]|nr:TIGR03435 family protein [Bryobacterales bacterium]MBV9396559.1 TIGR03435 family protein [Bryobacterales bacterium]
MLQHLLVERFNLAVHRETKEVSGYLLQVARNGPKLRESSAREAPRANVQARADGPSNELMITDANSFPAPRPGNPIYPPGATIEATITVNGRNRATVLNERMPQIAYFLGLHAGAPVKDQTGLNGVYDFHLEYVPRPQSPVPTAPDAPANASDPAPDLFDAVQSQLGLKLVPGKVPVEMLVIDRAERTPTPD